jgi:hypothetical protein
MPRREPIQARARRSGRALGNGRTAARALALVLLLTAALAGRPVLTVGADDAFAREGGMIALRTIEGRVRFEVNLAAATRAGLKVSARMLDLAFAVHGEGRGGGG